MAIVVCILNLKGGAGKTLVTSALASQWSTYLVEEEGGRTRPLRVLAVDLDPQGSLLEWSGKAAEGSPVPVVGLTEETLKAALAKLAPNYDVVVIDTPPRLAGAAMVALTSCSVALVPVSPGATDLWAMKPTLEAIRTANGLRDFKLFGLLNKADKRLYTTKMAKEVEDLGLVLLDTWLRNYDDHPSAMSDGTFAPAFKPNDNAALDVRHLATELGRHMGIA